jgi:DNA-binding transcriptional ArsR family regulator
MGFKVFRIISKYPLTSPGHARILYLEIFRNTSEVTMGFSDTMKALSDPVRREILNMLKGGTMSAGDIAARFDMTAATVSYHLAQLKKAGLVYEKREKNYIYYTLNASVLEEVLLWIQTLRGDASHEE